MMYDIIDRLMLSVCFVGSFMLV